MKKKIKYLFFILLIGVLFSNFVVSADTDTYSRSNLQNMVVSTAFEYYYNHYFSDYEQSKMSNGYNFRKITASETVNRSDQYYIDCSSFITSVYLNSLGFWFNDYADYSEGTYYKNLLYYHVTSSSSKTLTQSDKEERYNTAVFNYGIGINTSMMMEIAKTVANDRGYSWKFNNLKNTSSFDAEHKRDKIVAYYEKFDNNNASHIFSSRKSSIISTFKSSDGLQPGDLIVYRRTSTTGERGHVILYTGYNFGAAYDNGSDVRGFFHAQGKDYDFDENIINNDDFSVRFDDMSFLNDLPNTIISIAVLRPINNYCDDDDECTVPSLSGSSPISISGTALTTNSFYANNTSTRVKLKKLKMEQYFTESYSGDSGSITGRIGKYNSVNVGDSVTYNLRLKNMSRMSFCSRAKDSGGNLLTSKSACTNAGYSWITRGNKGESYDATYDGLVVKVTVPTNVEYTKCWARLNSGSDDDNVTKCSYNEESRTITWNVRSLKAETSDEVYLRYSGKVLEGDSSINYTGNTITYKGSDFVLADASFKVNPTLNREKGDILSNTIWKFKEKLDSGKFKASTTTTDSKVIYDDIPENKQFNFSTSGFVKSVYYNAFDLDLSNVLSYDKIYEAIFKWKRECEDEATGENCDYKYAKETEEESRSLSSTDTNYFDKLSDKLKISNMLVKGMYGGRLVYGNDNLDRVKFMSTYDLEPGDIIVYQYSDSSGVHNSMFIYTGIKGKEVDTYTDTTSQFVRLTSAGLQVFGGDESNQSKDGFTLFKELYDKDLFVVLRPSQSLCETVLYDYNGGSGSNDSFIYCGSKYSNIINPTSTPKFKVSFDTNGGNKIDDMEVGSEFFGWSDEINSEEDFNNDGDQKDFVAEYVSKILLPAPIKNGYVFDGWYIGSTFVGYAGDSYDIYSDTNFEAVWSEIDTRKYDIEVYVVNGTGNNSISVEKNREVAFYVKPNIGYANPTVNCTNGQAASISNDVLSINGVIGDSVCTIEYKPINYTITYVLNGSTVSENPSSYTIETDSFSLNNPTKEGYTFTGWTGPDNFLRTMDVTIYKGSYGDKEFIANFVKNTLNAKLTVKNGTGSASKTVEYDGTVSFDVSPNSGYGNGSITCTNETVASLNNSTVTISNVTNDTVCTLTYYPSNYNLKLDPNGGVIPENTLWTIDGDGFATKLVSYLNPYGSLPVPTRNKYSFLGWSTDPIFLNDGEDSYQVDESTIYNVRGNSTIYAIWKKISYTVDLNVENGSGGTSKSVDVDSNALFNIAPNNGYATPVVNCTNSQTHSINDGVLTVSSVSNNSVCTVTYSPVVYTIEYVLNDGVVSDNPTSYTVETDSFTLNNPTKDGYTFSGWTGTGLSNVTKNVTISKGSYGNKKYTANYVEVPLSAELIVNNGKGSSSKIVEYGSDVIYNVSADAGYGNGKISCTNDATASLNNDKVTISNLVKNTVCTLTYSANSYSMTMNPNGGVIPESSLWTIDDNDMAVKDVKFLDAYGTLPIPTKDKYKFLGWSSNPLLLNDDDISYKVDSSTIYTVHKDSIIYAIWEKIYYKVILNVNNGTGSNTFYVDEDGTGICDASPNVGYKNGTISCTNGISATLSGVKATISNVDNDTVCTLGYSPITYTISYTLNGGVVSGNPSSYTIESDSFTLKNPTKEGYEFIGWTGTGLSSITKSVTISKGTHENKSYVANFEKLKLSTELIVNNGDGSSIKDVEYGNNAVYDVSAKTGYSEGTISCTNGISATLNGGKVTISNVVNNTVCTLIYSPNSYTLTMNPNGGVISSNSLWLIDDDGVASKTIRYLETYGILPIPTRDKYKFLGWSKNSKKLSEDGVSYGVEESTLYNIADNSTIYAIWGKDTYNVELSVINGAGNNTKNVEIDNSATFTISPNSGYSNPIVSCTNGQTATISGNSVITGNITNNTVCTAKYLPIDYKIVYDLNGGVADNRNKYTVEMETFTLNRPTKKGYDFVGWIGSNGETLELDITIPKGSTGDKNYTAKYTKSIYKITYVSDEFGTITGISEEELEYMSNPSGTSEKPNSGYNTLKWIANVDVVLDDGTVLVKGSSISSKQIKKVVVNSNIQFSVYHYINDKYLVKYETDGNGTVSLESEEVTSGLKVIGASPVPNKGYIFDYWVANVDVALSNGTVISKNNKINSLSDVIVDRDVVFKAIFKKRLFTVKYLIENYGSLSVSEEKDLEYLSNLNGTVLILDEGYRLVGWTANKDVILSDDSKISKGNIISNEQLLNVIVDDDIEFIAKIELDKFKIVYDGFDDIKISGINDEYVMNGMSPAGTTIQNNNSVYWIADTDVRLIDNTIIKKGNKISSMQLTNVIVDRNIKFTAYNINYEYISNVPDTSFSYEKMLIILGLLLTITGGLYLLRDYKKENNL